MANRMTMEALLGWAYRQELPKHEAGRMVSAVGVSAWGAVSRYAELMTIVDVSPNRFGVIADFVETGEPHPDALLIADAVARLGDVDIEPGDDVLGDIEMLTPIERDECNARGLTWAQARGADLVSLVRRHALLGGRPAWRSHGEVKRSFERGPNGRDLWRRTVLRSAGEGRPDVEIELDGYDARNSRPFPGAWRRAVLFPDPVRLAAERIEYQAWTLALGQIAAEIAPALTAHVVDGVASPHWPWEGEAFRTLPKIFHRDPSMA